MTMITSNLAVKNPSFPWSAGLGEVGCAVPDPAVLVNLAGSAETCGGVVAETALGTASVPSRCVSSEVTGAAEVPAVSAKAGTGAEDACVSSCSSIRRRGAEGG